MKFKDPREVACPECSTTSKQRVAKLLALKATCPECSHSLADTGLKMRQALDDWSTYVIAIELTCELERALGCEFEDKGLEKVKTLRDVIAFVGPAREAAAATAMPKAVREVRQEGMFKHAYTGPDRDAELDFNLGLVEMFMPNRWDQR
jgi:hypothetical protein